MSNMLSGAPNARDLGGMKTADGRVLKSGRLIRSGMIGKITDADVEYLKSIDLRTVVDLRSMQEQTEKPNRVIEGVNYISCPILERKTEGITREKPETEDEEAVRTVMMAKRLMQQFPDGKAQMKMLYGFLVTEPHAIEHYRRFFGILLEHEEGTLLYHCMLGKDRAGVATALTLSALGVSREDIIDDYLITAERCAPGTARLIENCRRYTSNEDELKFIYDLDIVKESFIGASFDAIDKSHGGMDAFLRNEMCLDDSKLTRLKALYLE